MKKIIMAVVLGLMFISPANAAEAPIRNSDIMLMCWADHPDAVNTIKEKVTIILSPDNDIAIMIDPHNDMTEGKLTVSEYFYTITIDRLTNFGKTGVLKINRLSGVLSAVWTAAKTESRPFPNIDAKYGACTWNKRKQLF